MDVSLNLTLDRDGAAELAAGILARAAQSREQLQLSLPPSAMALEVGDAIVLDGFADDGVWQVQRVEEQGRRDLVLHRQSADGPVLRSQAMPGVGTAAIVAASRPALVLLDVPLVPGESDRTGPLAAVYASPWPGNVDIRVGGTVRASASRPAQMGVMVLGLPAGGFSGRVDRGTQLCVRMGSGQLASLAETDFLSGSNALAVQHVDGAWELLQFQNAQLQSDGNWILGNLLRGQQGSEDAFATPIAAGAAVVVVDGALVNLNLRLDELGGPLQYRARPARTPMGSDREMVVEFTAQGRALHPLSPVHLRGQWQDGDLHLSWIRRTRIGGDGWFGLDVPLGEEAEQYQVQLMDAGAIVHEMTTTMPSCIVPVDLLQSLFPAGLGAGLEVQVAQLANIVGEGGKARQFIAV